MLDKLKKNLSLILTTLSLFISFYNYFDLNNFKEVVVNDLNILNENTSKISNTSFTTSKDTVENKIPYNVLIKVTKVIDGDTIELEGGERLRYIGIDTPEMNFGKVSGADCFASEASKRNEELVLNKKIKFINDKNVRDKYGRLLGYVYLEDGSFVNEILVKEGFATDYPYKPDISKQQLFSDAEESAKKQNLGIWGKCLKELNGKN